jgi:hypothetical protein
MHCITKIITDSLIYVLLVKNISYLINKHQNKKLRMNNLNPHRKWIIFIWVIVSFSIADSVGACLTTVDFLYK